MVSIIVPVLNEEKTIESLLKGLVKLKGSKEIIVVDGGSNDKTIEIAEEYANVVQCKRGRAYQMNLGAKMASGNILWFVHSDSIVHEDSLEVIGKAIGMGYSGGGFSIYFYDYDTPFMRFVSSSSNIRAKSINLFFGDQGIFFRKDAFERVGRFPEIAIMEDWEFTHRVRKTEKLILLDTPIGSSARRFKDGGGLKTLMLMHKMKILYTFGVSPDKLAKIYREAR